MNKCVFLDRDGTIIYDRGYIGKIKDVKLISGAAQAIKKLNAAGYLVIVISNQSGIARGYFNEDAVSAVNTEIQYRLHKQGAYIDAFYWCPHFTEGKNKKYVKKCACRKPGIELFLRAAKDFNINLKKSYMIGDKASDIEAGIKAGCKSIFIFTKKEKKEAQYLKNLKIFYKTAKLSAAADVIINSSRHGSRRL